MGSAFQNMLAFISRYAGTPKARGLLYLFSALESMIIPVPVDPYLAACVLASDKKWMSISLLTALASVLGGAFGWLLGYGLQDILAQMIVLLPEKIAGEAVFFAVSDAFNQLGLVLVLVGAFTPLPYKIIAISAGLFGYGLVPFLILSAIGRSARFLLVGALVAYRRDGRLVTTFASLLLICILAGLYLTGHIAAS